LARGVERAKDIAVQTVEASGAADNGASIASVFQAIH
jgi:hypothetical protein